MRARSRHIALSMGREFTTPLLIPSISSRGFDRYQLGEQELSVASALLDVVAGDLNDALLISAYDISYGNLREAAALQAGFLDSVFANAGVLVIDSGGYEAISEDTDLSQQYRFAYQPHDWNEELLNRTLKGLASDVTAVLVCYDRYGSPGDQAEAAGSFFAQHPRFARCFLVKPGQRRASLDVGAAIEAAAQLRNFSILGVTEKELGETIEGRIETVARLRASMDDRGLDQPIHIFGALDTLFTPAYFLAGAEMFDGLTWLRYGYHDGLTIYSEMAVALEGLVAMRHDQRQARLLVDNLAYLRKMQRNMRDYARSGDRQVLAASCPHVWPLVGRLSSALQEVM
jgi:hypothetical protein